MSFKSKRRSRVAKSIAAIEPLEGRRLFAISFAAGVPMNLTTTAAEPYDVSAARGSDGRGVALWATVNPGGNGSELFAQQLNADGSRNGTPLQISASSLAFKYTPTAGFAANGNVTIAFYSGADASIHVQVYNPSLQLQNAYSFVPLNLANMGPIGVLSTGSVAVTWEQYDAGPFNGDVDVAYSMFDAAGNEFRSQVTANTTTAGRQSNPAIGVDSQGLFTIAWQGEGPTDPNGISMQQFDSGGGALGIETRVNSAVTNAQVQPAVAYLSNDSSVVAWVDPDVGVKFQQFDASGNFLGVEEAAATAPAGTEHVPSISANASGQFTIGWVNTGSYIVHTFDEDGTFSDPESSALLIPNGGPNAVTLQDNGRVQAFYVSALNTQVQSTVFSVTLALEGTPNGDYFTIRQNGGDIEVFEGGTPTIYPVTFQTITLDLGDDGDSISIESLAGTGVTIGEIRGGDGGDWIDVVGGGGLLSGGDGDDHFMAYFSGNTLSGGDGDDYLDFSNAPVDANLVVGGALTAISGSDTDDGTNEHFEGLSGDTYFDATSLTENGVNVETGGGDDTLIGSSQNDILSAGGGADSITGNGGNDLLYGGNANDTLNGNDGDDYLDGGFGDDTVSGGNGTDVVTYDSHGTTGVNIALNNTTHNGAAGENDTIDATNEDLTGGYGNDTITGNNGTNVLAGSDGDDSISSGGGGADVYYGGEGNDTLRGSPADDSFSGGNGIDTVTYSDRTENIRIRIGLFSGQLGEIDLTTDDLEILVGGSGNDSITARGTVDFTLIGNGGNDTLEGASGDDHFSGGAGVNTLSYGNHLDPVTVTVGGTGGAPGETDTIDNDFQVLSGTSGNDSLTAGVGVSSTLIGAAGDDTLVGSSGDDHFSGGNGTNTLSYAGRTNSVTATVGGAGGENGETDAIDDDFQIVIGGSAGDVFTGSTTLASTLFGNGGNDTLIGGGAKDRLEGGDGDDSLDGGANADVLYGSAGDDVLWGGPGRDRIAGGAGNDRIKAGSSNDTIIGEAGEDRLYGDTGDDSISGGDDNDYLIGGSGNDQLSGDADNDKLAGESGSDTLSGGAGIDRLDGGTGANWGDNPDSLDKLLSIQFVI